MSNPISYTHYADEATLAHITQLETRIHNAYEVYAGMEGIKRPLTCCESYLLQIIRDMAWELKPPHSPQE
jgi:hypothetical protein